MLLLGESHAHLIQLPRQFHWAAVAEAPPLGAIDMIQIHLPRRVPEVSDRLPAVVLTITLVLFDRSKHQLHKVHFLYHN